MKMMSPSDRTAAHVPDEAARGVMALAHHCGAKDWIPATSGNFSVRIDAQAAAITAPGSDKAKLTPDGIIRASITGAPHPRASAEAPLHLAMYRMSPKIGAVAHIHSLPCVLASLHFAREGRVRLEGLELLKAFNGIKT